MKKFLIPVLIAVMLIFAAASVSAQDVNVDGMSGEELLTLLTEVMRKLETSEEEAAARETTPAPTPTPTPTPTAVPRPGLPDDRAELEALLAAVMLRLQQDQGDTGTGTPEETPPPAGKTEKPANSVWENKKLLIEALPGYMFIQPTREPESEPGRRNSGGSKDGGSSSGGSDDSGGPEISGTQSVIDANEGKPCGTGGTGKLHYVDGVWYCKYE